MTLSRFLSRSISGFLRRGAPSDGVPISRKADVRRPPNAACYEIAMDLKLLTGCADDIPNSFAHQKPFYWGYEGNRTGLWVRFVLSHDTIFLYAPIVTPEDHRA